MDENALISAATLSWWEFYRISSSSWWWWGGCFFSAHFETHSNNHFNIPAQCVHLLKTNSSRVTHHAANDLKLVSWTLLHIGFHSHHFSKRHFGVYWRFKLWKCSHQIFSCHRGSSNALFELCNGELRHFLWFMEVQLDTSKAHLVNWCISPINPFNQNLKSSFSLVAACCKNCSLQTTADSP